MTSVLDRLVVAGWVKSYATDVHYQIKVSFTDAGLGALSVLRSHLDAIGPLSDIELAALAWIIKTKLPK